MAIHHLSSVSGLSKIQNAVCVDATMDRCQSATSPFVPISNVSAVTVYSVEKADQQTANTPWVFRVRRTCTIRVCGRQIGPDEHLHPDIPLIRRRPIDTLVDRQDLCPGLRLCSHVWLGRSSSTSRLSDSHG